MKQLLPEVLPICKKLSVDFQAPCDEHGTSNKNINLIKTHFRRTQPLAPRLSLSPHAAVLCCHPCPTQHLVKQLLPEVLQFGSPAIIHLQHPTQCHHKKQPQTGRTSEGAVSQGVEWLRSALSRISKDELRSLAAAAGVQTRAVDTWVTVQYSCVRGWRKSLRQQGRLGA